MAEMIDVDYLKILKDSRQRLARSVLAVGVLCRPPRPGRCPSWPYGSRFRQQHRPEWVVSGALETMNRALARERVLRQRNDEYRDLLARHGILGTASEDEVGTLLCDILI